MPWKPDYATADELATFARVDDDVDDVQYALDVTTASRAVDRATHRQFGQTTSEARFYTPRWSYTRSAWEIETDDYLSVTEVAVDPGDGTWAVVDSVRVVKLPANSATESRPYERIAVRSAYLPTFTYPLDCVRVTGIFGWSAVPVAIKEATLLQGSRLAARRDSPFGVAGSPENGSEIRLLARLDPDVLTSIKDYIRKVLP
jgi:hypothetical protein